MKIELGEFAPCCVTYTKLDRPDFVSSRDADNFSD